MSLALATARVRDADERLLAAGPRPFPIPIAGLEHVVAGSLEALRPTDWWCPGLRERIGAVLRDAPIAVLLDGTAGARPHRVAPPAPSPALRALHAVGLGLCDPDVASLVHLGIGSASDGAFHEALNLAALTGSRVIFVVAVHPLDRDAPLGPQLAGSPAALAAAFGIPAAVVDGSSAAAVHDAVAAARDAGGPHLIEARLPSAAGRSA